MSSSAPRHLEGGHALTKLIGDCSAAPAATTAPGRPREFTAEPASWHHVRRPGRRGSAVGDPDV